MLYGRFLNGGNIYIDNYSIVYNDYVVNNDTSTSNIYLKGGRKEYKFNSSEDLNDFNFYSEIYNQGFYYNDNKLTGRVMRGKEKGFSVSVHCAADCYCGGACNILYPRHAQTQDVYRGTA